MYPGELGKKYANRPAFIMASTGKEVTYAEFECRANQLAHYLRSVNLQFKDHYAIFMENNERFLEANSAGERAGLYYTCINSYLTANEVSYIINNSESQVLITSLKCSPP
jgi:long-chain acyl-CoA synthetase